MPTSSESTQHEAKDMALFNEIATAYCRKDLHPASMRGRKQRSLRTLASVDLPADCAMLEAGCGAGYSAVYLKGSYARFHGIDYAQALIDYANEHHAAPAVTFSAENIRTFEPAQSFDVIVMIGVLHHLDDMDLAIRKLVAALKPGGYLLANEPQSGNPLIRVARAVRKCSDSSYTDDQIQMSSGELRSIYQRAGLTDIKIVPQGIFSTPFAEVPLGPTCVTRPLARLACVADTVIESIAGPLLKPVTWNLIAAGRRPA